MPVDSAAGADFGTFGPGYGATNPVTVRVSIHRDDFVTPVTGPVVCLESDVDGDDDVDRVVLSPCTSETELYCLNFRVDENGNLFVWVRVTSGDPITDILRRG